MGAVGSTHIICRYRWPHHFSVVSSGRRSKITLKKHVLFRLCGLWSASPYRWSTPK